MICWSSEISSFQFSDFGPGSGGKQVTLLTRLVLRFFFEPCFGLLRFVKLCIGLWQPCGGLLKLIFNKAFPTTAKHGGSPQIFTDGRKMENERFLAAKRRTMHKTEAEFFQHRRRRILGKALPRLDGGEKLREAFTSLYKAG
jgi:hypothetical protein